MKKIVCGLAVLLMPLVRSERFVIDKLEAVIFAEEDTVIVTKSDSDRMTLNGEFRSIEDVILEQLMFQEAKKYKITADENTVNRYLADIQRENNIPLSEIKAMFVRAGYTYEEGRQQLATSFAVNSLVDFKIRSRLIVLDKDIQAYYDAHPVVQEAKYFLKHTIVPFNESVARTRQRAGIVRQIKTGKAIVGAQWTQAFWINKSDVDLSKHFIFNMKIGTVSKPREVATGFELFRLLDAKPERLVPLEDRYREITDALRKPRYEQLFASYKKELFDASSVVRF